MPKTLHDQKYQCPNCKIINTYNEWSTQNPEEIIPLECDDCRRIREQIEEKTFHIRSTKLTPIQKVMLKGDKAWKEDIMSRKRMANGDIAIVDRATGRIKEVRPRLGYGRTTKQNRK